MVRKKKSFWGERKKLKTVIIRKKKPLTKEQVTKKLMSRREITLRRILDNPHASPIAKAKARRMLGI